MIDTSLYVDIERDKKKLKQQANPKFATVIEVIPGKGVKIRVDGEEEVRETYYSSLAIVNAGDRVHIQDVSGTVLIMGNLTNPGGGGGSDVTKEYVDEQDQSVRGYVDTQCGGLDEKINDLSFNRGYLRSKDISNTNILDLKQNGKFHGSNMMGMPINDIYTWWVVDSSVMSPTYIRYMVSNVEPNISQVSTWIGIVKAGIFEGWEKIATTDKIDISLPLINGFTPITSPSWKTGIVKNGDGSYDLWFSVRKSDGSVIPINIIQIGTTVDGHKPDKFYFGSCTSIVNDLDTQDVFCYIDSSRLMVHNTKANAKELIGHIRYRTN